MPEPPLPNGPTIRHEGGLHPDSRRLRSRILGASLVVVTAIIGAAEFAEEPPSAAFWDNLHWTIAFAMATVITFLGYRDGDGDVASRTARGWFVASLVMMTFGQLMWNVLVYLDHSEFPGPADLPFLLVGVCIYAGLAIHVRDLPRAERGAYALDGIGITLAVTALTLALYNPRQGQFGTLTAIVLVAYPVTLLGAAGTALVVMLARRVRPNRDLAIFFASLVTLGICWILWNWRIVEEDLADGIALNYAFSYAVLAFGMSAADWRLPELRAAELERSYFVITSSVPLVLVLLAAIAVLFADDVGARTWVAVRVCAMVVVLVAIVRQSLLLRDRENLLAAERTVREAEERFRELAETIDDAFAIFDPVTGRPTYLGPAFERIWGRSAREPIDGSIAWSEMIAPEDRDDFVRAIERREPTSVVEYRIHRPDGEIRAIRDRRTTVGTGPSVRVVGILEDITETRTARAKTAELQLMLARSERLQSLGTLASGIAHDFNNILAAVFANAEIVSAAVPKHGVANDAIAGILAASDRARDLVKRMMVFARHESDGSTSVDVETLAREVVALLRPVVPSSVVLSVNAAEALPPVTIVASELHQVLVNLVTNANHAIGPRAGRIAIDVDERWLRQGEVKGLGSGRFVVVSVEDDGCGMDEATRVRIFDPFFTTKQPGEGTGLGLAVAHAVVTNHRGAIEVVSAIGRGTTFRIFLPANVVDERVDSSGKTRKPIAALAIDGEVLVVDDDAMVGASLVMLLQSLGLSTVAVHAPHDAIALVDADPSRFALVITDMTMPNMMGDELAEKLRELAPSLPIILVSGNEVAPAPGLFAAILAKPYTRASLAAAIARHANQATESGARAIARS